MKNKILFAAVLILFVTGALMFTAKEKVILKRSTELVLALCDTGSVNPYVNASVIYRIIQDSIKKDTFYYFYITAPVTDTLGSVICNTIGKDSIFSAWVPIENKRVLMDAGPVKDKIKNYKQ